MTLRVVLVGPVSLDPDRVGGGVETSFANLVEALAARSDVEPHVLTFDRGAGTLASAKRGGATVDFLPTSARFNNLTLYRGDRKALRTAFDALQPDVVHGQDAIGYGFATLKAARELPVVLSVHGIVREELKHLPRFVDRVRTGTLRVAVERYCVRHASYLVQPTPYAEEYFGSEIRGRIVDVGNPIGDQFFETEPCPEPLRLLYVGAVMQRKRLLDLIEALGRARSSLPGLELRVAGAVTDAPYGRAVAARVEALGLRDAVTMLGGQSPDEVLEEYRRAALLVLPSGQETSPMVIGEAMAMGLPVVATRTGGVPYLVDQDRTGWIADVGDVEGIAGGIVRILGDEGRHAAFAAAARAEAAERFRAAAVAERVVAVYRQAIASEQCRPEETVERDA